MSTGIEWATEVWNPTVGCTRVSPGCDGCYAMGVAHRGLQAAHEGLTIKRADGRIDWTGDINLLYDRLDWPKRWKKPQRIFVNSMSDLFAPEVPDNFIKAVWRTMAECPQHTFMILTKRPQRMNTWVNRRAADMLALDTRATSFVRPAGGGPLEVVLPVPRLPEGAVLPNVWLGTSIENARYAWRARYVATTVAAVHFLSIEPLIGHVVDPLLPVEQPLAELLAGIDWVIVGGESGPRARPMHIGWVRDIRDFCVGVSRDAAVRTVDQAHGYTYEYAPSPEAHRAAYDAAERPRIPFLFKQWGEWGPAGPGGFHGAHYLTIDGRLLEPGTRLGPDHVMRPWAVRRWGKKAAGRSLDGYEWDEYPA